MGITGMLILTENSFLQVLEGERKKISILYNKIANDERHSECELLIFEPIARRQFPEWGMYGVHASIIPKEFMEEMICKYGGSEAGFVSVPEDPRLAYSLILDLHSYSRKKVTGSI